MEQDFTATLELGGRIAFDDVGRRLRLLPGGPVYSYDAVRGYELLEENGLAKGGMARAFSLGFLSAGDGVRNVRAMRLRLILADAEEYIDLMITPAKTNTIVYKSLARTAAQILQKLREIHPENCADAGRNLDYTEELRRLRKLADDGVITEADFESKKKQILGL